MSEAIRVGGDGELFGNGRLTGEEPRGIAFDQAEPIPENLRLNDLNEYSDRFRDIIASKYPYLSEKELQSYRFADVNGTGIHNMVHVQFIKPQEQEVRVISQEVRVALKAIPQPVDTSRHNYATRQLRASIEALEQTSLIEGAVLNGSIDYTFTYSVEDHDSLRSLIEVVFDEPDIIDQRSLR